MVKLFVPKLRSLFIPARHAARAPSGSNAMKVGGLETRIAIGHSALGEAAWEERDLDAKLASWPWQQLVLKLGSIEYARSLVSKADWDADGMLSRQFLRPAIRRAAASLLAREGIIGNQPATAYLVQRTLRLGATGPDRGPEDHSELADILLAANDILYPDEAAGDESLARLEGDLAKVMLRSAVLSDVDAARQLLPRYYHLFGALADANQGKPGAVDVDACLKDLIGATLNQTFAVCIGVFGYFVTLADRQRNAWARGQNSPVKIEEFVLSRDTYLRRMGIVDGGQRFLAQLSTDPESVSDFQPRSPYDFEYLKSRPIIAMDKDRMAVPIPQLFFERATIMLWWDIHKRVAPERQNAFESWWGQLTEQYVYQLFERALGQSGGSFARWFRQDQFRLKRGTPPSPDVIVVSHIANDLALAFVEVKSSRPRYVDLVTGDIEGLRQHWRSRLIGDPANPKAVRQLDKGITSFFAGTLQLDGINPGSVRHIFPIVVTLDHWPMRSLLYEQFTQDVKHAGLLAQKSVTPVEVISCEGLEKLIGAAENGRSMIETLNQRRLTSAQSIPLRDWMESTPATSLLTEIWDRMTKELKSEFSDS